MDAAAAAQNIPISMNFYVGFIDTTVFLFLSLWIFQRTSYFNKIQNGIRKTE